MCSRSAAAGKHGFNDEERLPNNTGEASKSVIQGLPYLLYDFHKVLVGIEHDGMCDKTLLCTNVRYDCVTASRLGAP